MCEPLKITTDLGERKLHVLTSLILIWAFARQEPQASNPSDILPKLPPSSRIYSEPLRLLKASEKSGEASYQFRSLSQKPLHQLQPQPHGLFWSESYRRSSWC